MLVTTRALAAFLVVGCGSVGGWSCSKPAAPPPASEAATVSALGPESASVSEPASAAGSDAAPAAGSDAAPASPAKPAVSPELEIVAKPIDYGDERKRLTIEYRQIHQDPDIDTFEIIPKMIILHYTTGNSAESTWRYFNRQRMGSGRKKLQKAGAVNVSAHFLVDRDGTIYRLMPETWMARHCIGFNHLSIGVENVGDGDKYPLTEEQVEANARLIRYLRGKYPITHLIGHHEYRDMEGHEYFLERDPKYRNRKADPGKGFMRSVRAKVADLGLEGPPAR